MAFHLKCTAENEKHSIFVFIIKASVFITLHYTVLKVVMQR